MGKFIYCINLENFFYGTQIKKKVVLKNNFIILKLIYFDLGILTAHTNSFDVISLTYFSNI